MLRVQGALGQYHEALEKYQAAFLLRPDQSAFLFNIGQCYRQLGDPASAARSYRSYLREAPDETNRAAVEKLLAEMERAIEEKRAKEPPTGVATPDLTSPKPSTTPAAVPSLPTSRPTQPASPRRKGGIALLAGGAAFAVAGIALLGVAPSIYDSGNAAMSLTSRDDRHGVAGGLRIAGAIGVGIGAAALASGLGLMLWTARAESAAIWLAPTGNGIAAAGRF